MTFWPSGGVTHVRYCHQPSYDNVDITLQTQTVSSQTTLDPSEDSFTLSLEFAILLPASFHSISKHTEL